MHLVYLDESGNSGNNLNDPEQPLFLLCALIVPESRWLAVERDLETTLEAYFPKPRPDHFEIHGAALRRGKDCFMGCPVGRRIEFRNELLGTALKHDLRIVYRRIVKKQYQAWLKQRFGGGVIINPHVAAFPLVARVVDDYLRHMPDSPLGMFVFDENKEVVADLENSIKLLRGMDGALKLGRIIEKGFFIDSRKSLVLQLCDLCAFTIRRYEERKETKAAMHPVDEQGYRMLEKLTQGE